MDSPYRPGFGARPAVFVGREEQLARACSVLTRVVNSGEPASSVLVLVGPRGLGKTVMLELIAEEATARQMLVVQVALDSVSDGPQLLAGRLAVAAEGVVGSAGRSAWRLVQARLEQLSIEVNAGIVKVVSAPASRREETWTAAMREHTAALLVSVTQLAVRSGRRGVALLIDEVQQARPADLVVITNALQDALRSSGSPLAVFGAGLPNTPERVVEASSFSERFDFRSLQRLTPDQSERALLEPALQLGVTWEAPAVEAIVSAAGGSPYLLQLFGDETWTLADPEPEDVLTHEQAASALAGAQERLHDGMFRSRWAKTTGAERELLVAIAQTADAAEESETRDYTRVLGRTTQQLSPARQGLIDKGLVETAGRGRLRFTVPGFGAYVLDRGGFGE